MSQSFGFLSLLTEGKAPKRKIIGVILEILPEHRNVYLEENAWSSRPSEILSVGKKYHTKIHYHNNQTINNIEIVLDDPEKTTWTFWKV
jgi:hypothetical protein